MEDHAPYWATLALAFMLMGMVPYLWGLWQGQIKPHLFTWIIWTLMTIIVAGGQVTAGAGAGAWPALVTAVYCIIVLVASISKSDKDITRSDWYFLVVGLSAIPVWLFTSDPTWAVVLVTLANVVAYGPTIRKSWPRPWEEALLTYLSNIGKHAATLMAISQYNIATVFFPGLLLLVNIAIVGLLAGRRMYLTAQGAGPVKS